MRWVVVGVAALLVGLLVYGVVQQDRETTATAAIDVGERPPETAVKLMALGGSAEQSVDDYRGDVVLVNFWASWCKPCKTELPLLEKAQGRLAQSGGTVLGVNTLDSSEDAQANVDSYGLSFPSLRDPDGDYADEWGAAQLPESFLLDREGRVAAVVQGPVTQEFIDREVIPLAERGS